MDTVMYVRITKADRALVRKAAHRRRCTMAAFIRDAIMRHIEAQEASLRQQRSQQPAA